MEVKSLFAKIISPTWIKSNKYLIILSIFEDDFLRAFSFLGGIGWFSEELLEHLVVEVDGGVDEVDGVGDEVDGVGEGEKDCGEEMEADSEEVIKVGGE